MDPDAEKIIKFIEDRYKCSGLCQKPFFYLTQSIEKGPPKEACLIPLIKDVGKYFLAVSSLLITSAVVFFLMLICTCPICCFNKDEYKA